MKGIRNLLLLLLAIISQGAWAQEDNVPDLQLGDNYLSCDGFAQEWNGDVWHNYDEFTLYRFVASETKRFRMTDVTENPAEIVIAMFNSNKNLMGYTCINTDGWHEFTWRVEKDQAYYIGIRAVETNHPLSNEHFEVSLDCLHEHYTYFPYVSPTCETDGCMSHYRCNDCGAISNWDDFSNIWTEENLVIKGGHDIEQILAADNCFGSIVGHWECWRCGTCYEDEEGTVVISQDGLYTQKDGHHEGVDGKCTVCGQQVVLHKGENHVSFVSDQMGFVVFKYTAEENKRLVAEINCGNDIYPEIMQWDDFLDYMGFSENPSSAKRKAKKRIDGQGEEFSSEASWIVENGETYALIFWCYGYGTFDADITLSTIDLGGEISRGENSVYVGAFPDDFDTNIEQSYSNPDNYNLFRFEVPVTGDVSFATQGYICGALFSGEEKEFVKFNGPIYNNGENSFCLEHSVQKGEVYYLGLRNPWGDNVGRTVLNVTFSNVTSLYLGENIIDVAQSNNHQYYGYYQPDAFQNFTFEAEHSGKLIIKDVTDVDDQVLEMRNNVDYGSWNSWEEDGKSCISIYVEEGNTYTIGIREETTGKALQNVKLLLEMECQDHHFDNNGHCTNDWCSKQIRVLTEGLNEQVENNHYLFIPSKDGELVVYSSASYNEYEIFCQVTDEEGNVIHRDRERAPYRGDANTLEFKRVFVEQGKKYFLDLDYRAGQDIYDIFIEVNEVIPPTDVVEGDNNVTFPVGENQETVLKYTATRNGMLQISADTDAEIVDAVVMTWNEWLNGGDEGGNAMSAPRKTAARIGEQPSDDFEMTQFVLNESEYAIILTTTADSEENTSAVVSLNFVELACPEIHDGDNTVAIDAVSISSYSDSNPMSFNLFKFVVPASGVVHFSTPDHVQTYAILYDSDFEYVPWDSYNHDNEYTIFNRKVEEGETFYVGVRDENGYGIGVTRLVVDMEAYPEYEGKLFLAENDSENDQYYSLDKAIQAYVNDDHYMEQFTALGGVTYRRNATTSRWGTIVLPYELRSNNYVTYYKLSEIDGDRMTFSPVDVVPANTPSVYRFNNAAASYRYDASTSGPTLILCPELVSYYGRSDMETEVDDWLIRGWYDYITYTIPGSIGLENIRYISHDKFMSATKSLTIKPYRSVFIYVGENPSMAKTFTISIDGETDDIQAIVTEDGIEEVEAIYDLNGRKLDNMKNGVNIIRTADGKVHKIIKK